MSVKVSDFMALMDKGIARSSKYKVEFVLPRGINAAASWAAVNSESTAGSIRGIDAKYNKTEKINLFCHSATLPQRSIDTAQHKQLSVPYRVPISQSYDPVTFSFYADSDLNTREYFDIWQNAVINLSNNTTNFYDEFTSDLRITLIDQEGEEGYYVDLYECWPSNIGMVDLSYSNANALINVTVTLSYKYWQSGNSDTAIHKTV